MIYQLILSELEAWLESRNFECHLLNHNENWAINTWRKNKFIIVVGENHKNPGLASWIAFYGITTDIEQVKEISRKYKLAGSDAFALQNNGAFQLAYNPMKGIQACCSTIETLTLLPLVDGKVYLWDVTKNAYVDMLI